MEHYSGGIGMNNLLMEIAGHKRQEVSQLEKSLPLEVVKSRMQSTDTLDFKSAISAKNKINIIAEIKKASPSQGQIAPDCNPAEFAAKFRDGGSAALSVLADEKYFHGSPKYLEIAKKAARLPVLYKEFIVSSYQIYYARLMKADAVLLIAGILDVRQMRSFREMAQDSGMTALIEVHNEKELDAAVESGAEIIGVNNRNLEDFSVSMENSIILADQIPREIIKVAESGISSPDHIKELKQAGFDSFLVGEALMKSSDPVKLLKSLQQV
jgi:indole-3-glycerol phosphate synthase